MPERDEKLSALAFRRLYEVSEELKDEGADAEECWAIMFMSMQDLQAGDLSMGSGRHKETVQLQYECLKETLGEWDQGMKPEHMN